MLPARLPPRGHPTQCAQFPSHLSSGSKLEPGCDFSNQNRGLKLLYVQGDAWDSKHWKRKRQWGQCWADGEGLPYLCPPSQGIPAPALRSSQPMPWCYPTASCCKLFPEQV